MGVSSGELRSRLRIRAEAEGDREAVFAVQLDAFGRRAEAELVEALRGFAPRVSLVAERDGALVGHVLVSPVRIEGRPPACACGGLAPIGVRRAQQGRGVGSALMRAAGPASRAAGFGALFLLGAPAWYRHFGFGPAAGRGFHYDASADAGPAFQARELEPGALAGASGRVRYAEPFERL